MTLEQNKPGKVLRAHSREQTQSVRLPQLKAKSGEGMRDLGTT